jgi:tetratricopeptide (TPR) repeat protein
VPQRRPVELGVKPGELPSEPAPEANAKAESARQVRLGKEAFEALQYGRAIERCERAVAVAPDEALPYFMLAQARFAAGKYREAVAAIADGMKRRPDWPAARFQPRDLYGNNIGLFDNHLQALRQAVEAFPDDAGLLFLLGYELWFDGKKDEARRILEKAARRATDPTLIEAFLAEGEKVVRR